MTTMKAKFLITLSISAGTIFLLGCKKQLEIEPRTQLGNEAALKNVELMLGGAYSLVGSGGIPNSQEGALYGCNLLLMGDLLASEDYIRWRGTYTQFSEVANQAISPGNTGAELLWRKGYSAINLCNSILENLGGLSTEKQKLYGGQAKFLRAIVHFELSRFFGSNITGLGVPILIKSTPDFTAITYPARATIAEVNDQVIADLLQAEADLPDENPDADLASKVTAQAFLARVYLHIGKYDLALAKSNEVISSGLFSLVPSPEDAFNSSTSTESVFQIQQTTINNAGTTNDGLTTFYSCSTETPGSAFRGDVQIDSLFINQYEVTDKRRSILIYIGDCNKASTTSGKWKNPYSNIPVIRLAEILLIRAEANVRLGSEVGLAPLTDVNALRTRAGATPRMSVSLDSVLVERDLELAFEGHRIHDYRRTSRLILPKYVLPIPQTEINTNTKLDQNPTY